MMPEHAGLPGPRRMQALPGYKDGVPVVDDAGFPKTGSRSVGVACRYPGTRAGPGTAGPVMPACAGRMCRR